MRTLLRSLDLSRPCVATIELRLLEVPGVDRARVEVVNGRIVVDHDGVPDSDLVAAVADVGHVARVTSRAKIPA